MSDIDFDGRLDSPLWMSGADAWGQAKEYYNGKFPKTLSTGWKPLDEFYKVTPGQMTIVGGVPGHGKSSFLDCLMVNLVHSDKWRFAVYSPENYPQGIHAWHLMERYIGKPMLAGRLPRMTEKEFEEGGLWLEENFCFLTPPQVTIDSILACARAAHADIPIQGLVIDPWNEAGSNFPQGVTETDWISQCLTRIRQFARELNIHVWIVVHPRKIERSKDGGYPVPTPWDFAGSAHWRNKADAIITVWRDVTNEIAPTEVHVQKVRFRWVGKVSPQPITFLYDTYTGVYTAENDANTGNHYVSPFQRGRK